MASWRFAEKVKKNGRGGPVRDNGARRSKADPREAPMKSLAVMGIAAAVAGLALGFAGGALAAPTGPSPVEQTVDQLQANGYTVVVNKVGTAPLDRCSVSSVRAGQTFARNDSGVPGAGSDVVTTVTNKTVYVEVIC